MSIRTESDSRKDSVARRRWTVHLLLIVGFLAATLSPIFLSKKYLFHSGTTNHAIIGLIVLALVLVHLWQRRRTVWRLVSRFWGPRSPGARTRLAVSDVILWLLFLNTTISGIADFIVGHTIFLSLPGPNILQKWHALAVLVLLVYVIVHVIRRRTRLRTSHVR